MQQHWHTSRQAGGTPGDDVVGFNLGRLFHGLAVLFLLRPPLALLLEDRGHCSQQDQLELLLAYETFAPFDPT